MAVRVVAQVTVEHSVIFAEEVRSIELPVEAADGDLLMLTMVGGWTGDPQSHANSSDPRMTTLYQSVGDQQGEHFLSIYAMTMGSDRSPISVQLRGSFGGAGLSHFFAQAQLAVLRDEDGSAVALDLTRSGGNAGGGRGLGYPQSRYVFDIPGSGDAALGIYVDYRGGVGGVTQSVDWARVSPSWQLGTSTSGAYLIVGYILSSLQVVPKTISPHVNAGSIDNTEADPGLRDPGGPIWTYGLVKLDRPATRQWPRDDGLGMSAGPRIYPPPKSQRVVGGYQ